MLDESTANAAGIVAAAMRAWRAPPRLSLSQWADAHFYLSAESAAEPGRWHTLPYQRGILDAFTDPAVTQVSVMKSARVGWTKCMNILVAYYAAQDPCPLMVVQPTIEDAEGYSKEELAPMIRDVPVLVPLFSTKTRDSGSTLLHKSFPGGSVSVVGANSPRGFRRVSRKVVLFDETDGYPPSAGAEGDQIKLGIRRTEYYWDRKIGAGSTPTTAGASRIADLFAQGDQRRFFVPCPQCGHMAPLVFRGEDGHSMKWPEGKPAEAFFSCQKSGCIIEHKDKRAMVARGEWRAAAPFKGHASFHVWAAYSFSPNASWGQLAEEFIEANGGGPEKLKTFVNTVLGETWQEKGEAPEWQRLYQRREPYDPTTIPAGVLVITAGVDVQRDRLVYEVVGWGEDRQSWGIDAGEFYGDTAREEVWGKLDELLMRAWPTHSGTQVGIRTLAVDSGDQTQVVYSWARKYPLSRVIAVKGSATARALIDTPSKVDVTVSGKRLARGYRVWPVGVGIAKSELYGWLRLEPPTKESGAGVPPGFCHFPEAPAYGEQFFRQLTGEQLVPVTRRTGFIIHEWQLIPGRENHFLDCRVYARAAAALVGLDRHAAAKRIQAAPAVAPPASPPPAPAAAGAPAPVAAPAAQPSAPAVRPSAPGLPSRPRGSWLGGGGGGGWLKKR